MRTHPHAEASYRVVRLEGGNFAVEVSIPGSFPTKVSSFPDEAAAEVWIERDKVRIRDEGDAGKWFKRRNEPRRGR
jgi:hypothetical protein